MIFLFNITCQDSSEYLNILPAPIYYDSLLQLRNFFGIRIEPHFSYLVPSGKELLEYIPILQCAEETTFPDLIEVPVCIRLSN